MHDSKIGMKLEMESKRLCDICERVEGWVDAETSGGPTTVDAREFGMMVDWLKDIYEAKEKMVKACYYKELMSTMEEDSETEREEREERKRSGMSGGKMYFPMPVQVQGSNSGSAAQRGFPGPYNPNAGWPGDTVRMDGASWSGQDGMAGGRSMGGVKGTGGRRGFSFDSYEEALEMYPSDDPESKKARMESLNRDLEDLVEMSKGVVSKMSPEERQVWKGKISKILNA